MSRVGRVSARGAGGRRVPLHQGGVDLWQPIRAVPQPMAMYSRSLEPERRCAGMKRRTSSSHSRILQAQPLERGLDHLDAAGEQLVQELGHDGGPWMRRMRPSMKVPRSRRIRRATARSSEAVGVIRASGQRQAQPVVEREAARNTSARRRRRGGRRDWYPLRAVPVRAPSIRRSASESTLFGHRAEMVRSRKYPVEDRVVAPCPASAIRAQRDPVAVENVGAVLAEVTAASRRSAEALGLR